MVRIKGLSRLFLLGLVFIGSAVSASTSTIENNTLIVPRVDIEGYGALQLVFHLSFQGEYFFDLGDATPASESTENAGVFDASVMELELYEIQLETGELYTAKLGLVPDSTDFRFRILEAQQISSNDPPVDPPVPTSEETISTYQQQCATCHGISGQGSPVGPSLIACANCGSLAGLAGYIEATMPIGNSGACDQQCADALAAYIINDFNAQNQQVSIETTGFLSLLAATDTVRKAGMKLVSRFPTVDEMQMASALPSVGMPQVIDGMMEEEGFYRRLSEIFNDYLLTDKYHSSNGSEAAIRLLDRDDFPDARWFDPGEDNRDDNYNLVRITTNDAIAREPLELINYIVRNNRPFTEIVTADYIMVNPHSALSYGISNVAFENPNDATEFKPGRIDGMPHSGILTSPMFLNRYPTTQTNRNRGRARVVFDLFLDTDILAIEGVRPGNAVDITTPIPTIDNPECSKCHSVLDPVASVFQNWDYRGRYRPARLSNGWYADMESRGFNGEIMPLSGNIDSSVQWLGGKIAADPKFPRAVVRILVNGLTGKEPLSQPVEGATQAEQDAYIAERTLLNDIQQKFAADNYNLKTLVREIILSPYWRADGLTADANPDAHLATGSQQLLSPEMLDRKIASLLGFEWRGHMDNYYKDKDRTWSSQLNYRYQQIYGGIDSDTVVSRLTSPNGLMGAMQLRMANELACYSVPQEFLQPAEKRKLFPFVENYHSPYNEAGELDATSMELIKLNIQYLHEYLWGEYYPLEAAELLVAESIFMQSILWGRQHMENEDNNWSSVTLPSGCGRNRDIFGNSLNVEGGPDNRMRYDRNFVMRSWMAVLAYMLADYKFLYE